VLEIEKREEEKDLARAANSQLSLAHRTVSGGAPDTRLASGELAALGRFWRRTTIIHQTVRGAPDCPVSQRSPAQRSAAQSAGDAWPAPTVRRGYRTVRCPSDSVRCANCHESATVVYARIGRRSAPDRLQ
jgi:hypothetical protein